MVVMITTGCKQNSPPGVRPHLDVKLAPEWRYDAASKAFVATNGEEFVPGDKLPGGIEIRYTVPDLAKRKPSSLSEAELDLVAYVQVIFLQGTQVEKYINTVKRWPCVLEVRKPPQISLP